MSQAYRRRNRIKKLRFRDLLNIFTWELDFTHTVIVILMLIVLIFLLFMLTYGFIRDDMIFSSRSGHTLHFNGSSAKYMYIGCVILIFEAFLAILDYAMDLGFQYIYKILSVCGFALIGLGGLIYIGS
jgi:hypothetical protein